MKDEKCIFITYNQAYHPLIVRILNRNNLRGYTSWQGIEGEGSRGGEPHLGSHAWPTLNSAMMTIVPSDKVTPILGALRKLDESTPEQGLRAFVLPVEQSI